MLQTLWDAAWGFVMEQWELHPTHIVLEVLFLVATAYFYFRPLRKANKRLHVDPPTEREKEQLLEDFASEPFRMDATRDSNVSHGDGTPQVHRRSGSEITVTLSGETSQRVLVDAVSFDHFEFSTNPQLTAIAKETIRAYGVGSCGPRGFYGTVKPHLDAEEAISKFLGVESTVIYSFCYSVSSTIFPSFSCRGDVLICDEQCWLPIRQGAKLSRSTVLQYRHSDVAHLEEVMKQSLRKHVGRSLPRRAVITEGLFRGSGDIAPLKDIMALCRKYKFRLFVDDSAGFGVLGPTGRGTPELFGIPTKDIHLYIGSLGSVLGSVGGFCSGSKVVGDHQRLTATGYVFSASLPPYATAAVAAGVELLRRSPQLPVELQRNAAAFRSELARRLDATPTTLQIVSAFDDLSPVVFLRASSSGFHPAVEEKLSAVVRAIAERGFLVQRHLFTADERGYQCPSIRISLKAQFSERLLSDLASSVAAAACQHFPKA